MTTYSESLDAAVSSAQKAASAAVASRVAAEAAQVAAEAAAGTSPSSYVTAQVGPDGSVSLYQNGVEL
jgi:hypothetical protein